MTAPILVDRYTNTSIVQEDINVRVGLFVCVSVLFYFRDEL